MKEVEKMHVKKEAREKLDKESYNMVNKK